MADAFLPEEDLPDVDARRDLPDLVADHARHDRRARVVDDDGRRLVEPAQVLVDARPDARDAER